MAKDAKWLSATKNKRRKIAARAEILAVVVQESFCLFVSVHNDKLKLSNGLIRRHYLSSFAFEHLSDPVRTETKTQLN